MAIDISADAFVISIGISGAYRSWIYVERNPDLDITYDCLGYDSNGDPNQGILVNTPNISGDWIGIGLIAESLSISPTITGSFIEGTLVDSDVFSISPKISADVDFAPIKTSWIQWSNIGALDFTIGQDNIAGTRPMDWAGFIFAIKKLRDKVIVYGSNGVSLLKPSGVFYGLETILRIGLLGRYAITGDDQIHYFVDVTGVLWSISDQLIRIGYAEYLSTLSNPVMSMDLEERLVYICDADQGYVFSIDHQSLGECSAAITGFCNKDGISYPVSPNTIVNPVFEIATDIIDMGTRKFKTIRYVEYSTNLTKNLLASISFRSNHNTSFSNTGWKKVTFEGISHIRCYGIEFIFRLKSSALDSFALDSMKINGIIHRYNPNDLGVNNAY